MALDPNYKPIIVDKWLHVAQSGYPAVQRYIPWRYGMSAKIIVIHIQEGTSWGSWEWFHTVKASATVFANKDGSIWRLVPEEHGPWTNGDVNSPDAFARAFMNKWGPDPNAYTLSIETEGYTGEFPKTGPQMDAVEWQVRDWIKRYPDITDVYVVKHGQINSVDRRYCPGDAYYNELMRRLRDTPVVVAPVYASANRIEANGTAWDGHGDVTIGDRKFYGLNGEQTVTCRVAGVQPHVYATRNSANTRSALAEGDTFTVIGWCHGEEINGEDRWWITKHFSRIDVNGTVEKPPVASDNPQPDAPVGTRIINGRVYYPAKRGDSPTRKLRVTRKANLRAAASLKSKVVGTVAKGDIIEVEWWCTGGEVNDYRSWWILKAGDGTDSIKHGARLWSDATEAHPEEEPTT